MFELLLILAGLAVGCVFLCWLFVKILIGAIVIPLHIGAWAIKGVFWLVIGLPLAIIACVLGAVVVPVLTVVAIPILLVLAIPLFLLGLFVGFLKLIF